MRGVRGNIDMPLFGIGTWQFNDTVAEKAVSVAFKLGYRHVDTAVVYNNAVGVGKALNKSGISRDRFFVTSKGAIGANNSAFERSLYQNLEQLQLDYVDL